MNGRGTVELILAMIIIHPAVAGGMGYTLVSPSDCLSLLVFTAFITTLMTSIALKYVYRKPIISHPG
jgi:hypothetical protein